MRAVFQAILAAALLWAAPVWAQAPSTWNPQLDRKCAARDGAACWQLGETLMAGRGVAADPVKALDAFVRACNLSLGEACYIAAAQKLKAGDRPGANLLFRKGCEAGIGDSCLNVAIDAWKSRTGPDSPNEKLALAYFDRACTLRAGEGCLYLAQIYGGFRNPFTHRDPRLGTRYAVAGCAAGYAPACTHASEITTRGHGGYPPNPAGGEKYAQMGCSLGDAGGCMLMGAAAAKRDDWTGSRTFYARACGINRDPPSCKAVGDIDKYLADKARYDAEMARVNQRRTAGRAQIDGLIGKGDYNGAMFVAAYQLGSADQVSRVLAAASGAGQMGQIDEIYFIAFASWSITPQAREALRSEQSRRSAAARRPVYYAGGSGGGSSWSSSAGSASSQSVTPLPPYVSSSSIYQSARDSNRSTYCSAGWGCR